MKIHPNDEKFRELILYIAEKSEGDERFGATKLNKLLFYIDFFAYLVLGQPITGHEYKNRQFGPAPRRLMPIQEDMLAKGEIAIRPVDYFGQAQNRMFALRPARRDIFSTDEIALIDRCVEQFWKDNATSISEQSHQLFLWELTERDETIPYEMALVSTRRPTGRETDIGLELEPLAAKILAR